MAITYPTIYRDKNGQEITTIQNDGKTLRMVVRGVEFSGTVFDQLAAPPDCDKSILEQFVLFLDFLYGCEIDCEIPILVVDSDQTLTGVLRARLELGDPETNRSTQWIRIKEDGTRVDCGLGPDLEILQLELVYGDRSFKSGGKKLYATFDEQLTEIQEQLPADVYIKMCWSCALAAYDRMGSDFFGHLGCFRDSPYEYLKDKPRIHLRSLWMSRTESVQEIYLCPRFERRRQES